jgi:hypothetical protein
MARGKPHTAMTATELREATAEFDREFAADTFGPPTPQQGAQDRRARRKRGRPRVGRGANEDHFRHDRDRPVGQGGSYG